MIKKDHDVETRKCKNWSHKHDVSVKHQVTVQRAVALGYNRGQVRISWVRRPMEVEVIPFQTGLSGHPSDTNDVLLVWHGHKPSLWTQKSLRMTKPRGSVVLGEVERHTVPQSKQAQVAGDRGKDSSLGGRRDQGKACTLLWNLFVLLNLVTSDLLKKKGKLLYNVYCVSLCSVNTYWVKWRKAVCNPMCFGIWE